MIVKVKREERRTTAYYLAPEQLTVVLPMRMGNEHIEKTTEPIPAPLRRTPEITIKGLKQIVKEWARKIEVQYNGIIITKAMKNKWASCSTRMNATFNDSLRWMPKEFVEYVVCHELLHMKVSRKHSKLFNVYISAYMPDWRERIERTANRILEQPQTLQNVSRLY